MWIILGLERDPRGLHTFQLEKNKIYVGVGDVHVKSLNFWIAGTVPAFGIDHGQSFSG